MPSVGGGNLNFDCFVNVFFLIKQRPALVRVAGGRLLQLQLHARPCCYLSVPIEPLGCNKREWQMSSAAESRTMTSIRQDVLSDPVTSTGLLLCLLGTPGPKRAAWRRRVL